MNICLRSSGEAVEKIMHQLGLQISDESHASFGIHDRGGTTRKIDSRKSQGFVHRHHKVSGSQNAALTTQRLREGLPKRDPDVLHRVVLVHVEVSVRREFQIKSSMVRK
jgi:hypothetical protein